MFPFFRKKQNVETYLIYEATRSEEHTSELQSQSNLVCRLLLEKKKVADEAEEARHETGQSSVSVVQHRRAPHEGELLEDHPVLSAAGPQLGRSTHSSDQTSRQD